jgi:hypothetical protein
MHTDKSLEEISKYINQKASEIKKLQNIEKSKKIQKIKKLLNNQNLNKPDFTFTIGDLNAYLG